MSRFGVKKDGEWWAIVVSRSVDHRPLDPVWICRGGKSHLLCQVSKSKQFGWDVVVGGEVVIGPRLVEGFKTRWQAIQYATRIRPDINAEYKEAMRL